MHTKKGTIWSQTSPQSMVCQTRQVHPAQGFKKGNADSTLYIKIEQDNMIIIEVHVNDIIFGSDDEILSQNILEVMQKEFEMSMLGDLGFLLGLQISQKENGIFIS